MGTGFCEPQRLWSLSVRKGPVLSRAQTATFEPPTELSDFAVDAMKHSKGPTATSKLQRREPSGRAGGQVVRNMWFRKQNRPHPEGATKVKAYLDSSAPRGAEVQPLSSFLVDDVPRRRTPNEPLDTPNLSLDLRSGSQQAAKFEPDWSRLARNFVINPGAANNISSIYNVLRMRSLKSMEKNGWSTVVVTSPTRESGNTLTAINLAISIARDLNS